ncbi:MAG: helix-turn-helix transcriptional regulator [Bacteroides sp.]|nr:helix-turn-helix transcriptional regulator [Bacteroides sp.]
MENNFKDIYIGKIIQQKVDERGLSYTEFARKINCARTSLYHIFNSKNIDIERLLLISEILQYDFIEEIYLKRKRQQSLLSPCIVLPFNAEGIDFTTLPEEIIELLKRELVSKI